MGLTEDEFWHMNPRRIKIRMDAYRENQKRIDSYMHIMGAYVCDAVVVAVDKALNGRKSRAKYMEKSFTEQYEEKHRLDGTNMTEDQKQQYLDRLVNNLDHLGKQMEAIKANRRIVEMRNG